MTTITLAGTEVAHTDPTRIAAQVVTGVGFLGGGAILREGATVRGLTTAATLWAAAAIGLACGLGAYPTAAIAAGTALLVTIGLRLVERAFFPRRRGQDVSVTVQHDALLSVVGRVLKMLPPAAITVVATSESGTHLVQFKTRPAPAGDFAALAHQLLAVDGVVGVELRR